VSSPVLERYDALVMDLDGVVYRGDRVIPGAAQALPQIRARGVPVVFLTNNSARTPDEVADRLVAMGVEAAPQEILTSALATAVMLRRERFDAPPSAFVIGERGIREALEGAGVRVVDGEPDRTDLVVVGWDRRADYARLRTASLLVQRGARLVATNPDTSYPAPDGLWPGAGALLAVIVTTTGAAPTVVGKPSRPMFEAAAAMTGAQRPLMVGDRLDTDIAGAAGAGWDSMLVLTGASRTEELATASASAPALPIYVGADLAAVLAQHAPARPRPAAASDLPEIQALLATAGIASEGAQTRLDGTVVLEGGPTGAGSILATATVTDVGGHRYLRSVAVREQLRGQGLGLLAAAAALRRVPRAADGSAGPEDRAGPTYLFTATAAPFFQRLGFRPVHGQDLPEAIVAVGRDQGCDAGSTAMVLSAG
jgi:glycerol 3-phosphatase-2